MSNTTEEQDFTRASERERNAKSKCAICREKIVGKAWRVEEGKYACTRCNNEAPGA